MWKNVPSLDALRAFEAGARLGSLKDAARELHLTPSAVSRRIQSLEAELEVALFVREAGGVRLSEAGQHYLEAVGEALAALDAASASLRPGPDAAVVRLSVLPSFASHWLVPRLPAFEAEVPGIEVRLEATTRYADLARDPIDAAIRFGTGPWPGLRADRLAPLTFFPVCSPRLVAGATPLRDVADLALHTWLEEAHVPGTWERWLDAAGHPDVSPPRMLVYDHAQLLLDAAIAGQGVGIMTDILAVRSLEAGELVAPFALRAPTDHAYHLVTPEGRALPPALARFREWILDASRTWARERDEARASGA